VGARGAAAAAGVAATSTRDLFAPARYEAQPLGAAAAERLELCEGAAVLRGFALPFERALRDGVRTIEAAAPLRHMRTPGGYTMSVAMTNCGAYGWVSDTRGYRYSPADPDSGAPWPEMPAAFAELARDAAAALGFARFVPDACLVNRYEPGARLTLHQDKDEQDFDAPIVSVSLGVPAVFLFGGLKRKDRPQRVPLEHGDVVVWGGPARLRYHGVAKLDESSHPFADRARINLTLRRAR